MLEPGQSILHYRIFEKLREGGLGHTLQQEFPEKIAKLLKDAIAASEKADLAASRKALGSCLPFARPFGCP